ncbi:hypothetical protein CL617_02500 [archaeon]|jgi:hypothetical protein|nr:hypothetical protein [archaeon]|tara:strand:+ start:2306 stop:2962 length:657 start_codon:yes stop_codon:yes gene_type:complete
MQLQKVSFLIVFILALALPVNGENYVIQPIDPPEDNDGDLIIIEPELVMEIDIGDRLKPNTNLDIEPNTEIDPSTGIKGGQLLTIDYTGDDVTKLNVIQNSPKGLRPIPGKEGFYFQLNLSETVDMRNADIDSEYFYFLVGPNEIGRVKKESNPQNVDSEEIEDTNENSFEENILEPTTTTIEENTPDSTENNEEENIIVEPKKENFIVKFFKNLFGF